MSLLQGIASALKVDVLDTQYGPVPVINEAHPDGGVTGYERLAAVLQAAYDQASAGKGKERHASNGVAFEDQPMNSINRLLGSYDGHIYQAVKKSVESKRLPKERAIAELLGAINYLAGAVIHIQDTK